MTVSPEKIAEMLAAAEKATPGPWSITQQTGGEPYINAPYGDIAFVSIAWEMRDPELNYLVHLDPQTITDLLTELQSLRSQLSGMTEETMGPVRESICTGIVADELRKNVGFRLLVTLAYSAKDYEQALPEAADVMAGIAVTALRKKGVLK